MIINVSAFIIIDFVSTIQTDLTEDENILCYIKIASTSSGAEKYDDGEEPPSKKLCHTENRSPHQVLEPVSEKDFAELMNTKRNRFNLKLDSSQPEDENLDFEKQLVNSVCDPEVIDLIARKLLSRSS
jgi:hypothetical protein